jgi:predicted ATP-grasp superfamily ATP-dependent carboligase
LLEQSTSAFPELCLVGVVLYWHMIDRYMVSLCLASICLLLCFTLLVFAHVVGGVVILPSMSYLV